MSPYETVVARRRQEQFDKVDCKQIAAFSDKDLAAWQSNFKSNEPEWRLAENEWQRRLIVEQIKAGKWAAFVGLLGVILGVLLAKCLEKF
jgi:hypothetical protein